MSNLIQSYSMLFSLALALAPALAFAAVIILIPLFKNIAPLLGLMDHPNNRKKHETPTPLIGGLIIFPVFIALSIGTGDTIQTHWPLYSAIVILLLTGAIDDRVHLHPLLKFSMQFLAAYLIVVPGGAQLYQLGDLFGLGDFGLDAAALPFSLIATVLLINAINLIDGLDGLAGGASFIILGWLLYACISAGGSIFTPSILLLMATIAGFLLYNMRSPLRKRAMVFMGDAGSMSLGAMVAWYAIKLSPEDARIIEPISVAWILAIPIWDECAQFYRRVREGRHPFSPDRGHLHHHFIRAGCSDKNTVLILLCLIFITGGLGLSAMQAEIPLAPLTILWCSGILIHIACSRHLEFYPNLIKKFIKKT